MVQNAISDAFYSALEFLKMLLFISQSGNLNAREFS